MIVHDMRLAKIIEENQTVLINGEDFHVIPNPKGGCDGCDLYHFTCGELDPCSSKAIAICTSNGGNILKLAKQNTK